MLASLLPGLREIRSPLAAGYLWLVTLWLAFAPQIPPPGQSTGLVQDIYVVAQAAGASSVLVAASFTAYLLGALSVQLSNLLVPTIGVLRPRGQLMSIVDAVRHRLTGGGAAPSPDAPTRRSVLSANGQAYLREAVIGGLASRVAQDGEMRTELSKLHALGIKGGFDDPNVRRILVDIRYDIDLYARELEQELPSMPLRLLDENKDLYTEFDRLRAEAEFRAAVSLPLAALALVVGFRVSFWWLFALLLPILLVLDAIRSATAAADVLANAIRARAPRSSAVEEVLNGPLQSRGNWLAVAADRYTAAGAMVQRARALEQRDQAAAALEYYRKAADAEHPDALFWLAAQAGVADDQAETWIRAAAAHGHAEAQEIVELAGPVSFATVRTARAGNRTAMVEAGRQCLAVGNTVAADRWFRQATKAGGDTDLIGRDEVEDLLRQAGKSAEADSWRAVSDKIRRGLGSAGGATTLEIQAR